MRHLLLFLHVFGFVLWMGGGFATMSIGALTASASRAELGAALLLQGRLMRGMILPGVVLVVISGLILTLRLYGSATSASGFPAALMVMQAAGLLAAGLVLVVSVPTVTRLGRLDPAGPHAALFDALHRRIKVVGMMTGVLAVVALIGGVLLR